MDGRGARVGDVGELGVEEREAKAFMSVDFYFLEILNKMICGRAHTRAFITRGK